MSERTSARPHGQTPPRPAPNQGREQQPRDQQGRESQSREPQGREQQAPQPASRQRPAEQGAPRPTSKQDAERQAPRPTSKQDAERQAPRPASSSQRPERQVPPATARQAPGQQPRPAAKQGPEQAPAQGPEQGAPQARSSTGRSTATTVVPGFIERVQNRVSKAATEHRANATPDAGRRSTAAPKRQPRRARLRLTRVDPWSVMKTSFLLSVAFGVVTFVAVFMIWSVLGAAGVWESINSTVASVVEGDNNTSSFDVTNYVGMTRVLGFTALVAVIDVILLTAIATLGAFLYNMSAALLGGVELTLVEDDR